MLDLATATAPCSSSTPEVILAVLLMYIATRQDWPGDTSSVLFGIVGIAARLIVTLMPRITAFETCTADPRSPEP
ncbi:hypothetical protein [Microbacterium sp.]|uniref:hypothetical protein n=1 Tax=Microbacterium sp. TaxID=51671 RepID=UPI003A92EECA